MGKNPQYSRKSTFRNRGRFLQKRQQTKKEWQEFGPGVREFLVCSDCGAVYWKKSWHHGFGSLGVAAQNKRIVFARCPACTMVRDRKFEGELILRGIPGKLRAGLLLHLKNVGETAWRRDPLDRIIGVTERGQNIRITTTENRLALRLGREVKQLLGAYGSRKVKFTKEEDIVRVVWVSKK